MFFTLSKIFWMIFAPLNLVFILLTLGLALILFRKRAGRAFVALAMIVLIIFGVFPTGRNMLTVLENRYKQPDLNDTMPDWINTVLVLGGSFNTALSQSRRMPAVTASAERITEMTGLMHRYPSASFIFSGGNGTWQFASGQADQQERRYTESRALKETLGRMGVTDDNVLYEDTSRNTYENIRFTYDLFMPLPSESWVVVTSAYHMPRAVAVMKTMRWPGDIIPYPVDYRTDGTISWLPGDLDIFGNMRDAHLALREYAGLMAYQLTGKISYPLPEPQPEPENES